MHFTGPTKSELLATLRSPSPDENLPIGLGMYVVKAKIVCEQSEWKLIALEINREKAKAEGKRRQAAGEPWWPEMEMRFLEPTKTLATATSASELADHIDAASYSFFRT